jgi:hypothetical protein
LPSKRHVKRRAEIKKPEFTETEKEIFAGQLRGDTLFQPFGFKKNFRFPALKALDGDWIRPSHGGFLQPTALAQNDTSRLRETLIACGAPNEQIVKDASGYDFRLCSR